LLVDDDARNLDVLESILAAPDYRLVRAQNADEALRALVSDTFALMVLDIRMPDMSGLELAHLIKQRKKTQHLPLIFLTAYYQEDEHVLQGYVAGAVDYLSKPCNPAVLRSKVAVFVDLFRKSRALESEIAERWAAEQKVRDLNDQLNLRIAQLDASNNELEAFSYSVSHDLRAPLRQVVGFAHALRRKMDRKLDPDTAEYLALIEDAVNRMGVLIDDLLEFSRMGRSALSHEQVDLRALLDQAMETVQGGVNGRQIDWEIGPLPEVRGDPAMLRQVWTNLLDNAVKFTRPRERAHIQVGSQPLPQEYVFFVRDNGVGFDPNYADKLFGVFQRLHTRDEFEGTGIGLASVRRIISRHSGRAWVESEPDRGTTIYFSLPRQAEKQPAMAHP
jgi:two-component system sensor histidine kinase/response regulator